MTKILCLFCFCLALPIFAGVQCSQKFWDSFNKLGKDEQDWNRIVDFPVLTQKWGYTWTTMSRSIYSPTNCQIRKTGDPIPIYKNNEFVLLKDGVEVAKTYWQGGLVVSFRIVRDGNSVQVMVGELHYNIWQRNGKTMEMEKILKLIVYKLVWKGEIQ